MVKAQGLQMASHAFKRGVKEGAWWPFFWEGVFDGVGSTIAEAQLSLNSLCYAEQGLEKLTDEHKREYETGSNMEPFNTVCV